MTGLVRDTPRAKRLLAEEEALLAATELVTELMEVRKTTRSGLAKLLGIGRSEITQRLNGSRNLTVRTLAAMVHELGYDLQFRVHDRAEAPHVWRTCGEASQGLRYTPNGNQIRMVPAHGKLA